MSSTNRGAVRREADAYFACGLKGYDLRMPAVEAARARGLLVWPRDALADDWGRPAAVVMNPPYSLAMPFVERALAEVRTGGSVAALLRLAFLASGKRAAFMRANAPNVYVLSKRPSFTNGGTDSADYAWMVWRAGVPQTSGRVEVLSC